MNFKLLNFGLPGKIAGSGQPGGHIPSGAESSTIARLKNGDSMEGAGIPPRLISNLNFILTHNISVIYNLIPNPNPLAKYLWETSYNGTYITEIDGVSIAIDNLAPPTQEQLNIITDDALERMKNDNNILVHCEGGLGRTGTILSAVYMKANDIYLAETAIQYIRGNYARGAVEKEFQEESLQTFGINKPQPSIISYPPAINPLQTFRKKALAPSSPSMYLG